MTRRLRVRAGLTIPIRTRLGEFRVNLSRSGVSFGFTPHLTKES